MLARALSAYERRADVLVLALPRGGVPVAYEVAEALGARLDVFVVRKLGVPGEEEVAMGAIASGGVRVMNEDIVRALGLPKSAIDAVAAREEIELRRREVEYRGKAEPAEIAGKVVILTDDGLATGASMRAAALALRARRPTELIAAVPVGARSVCIDLERSVDHVFCPLIPEPFLAVGRWYEDFRETPDDEVRNLMAQSRRRMAYAS